MCCLVWGLWDLGFYLECFPYVSRLQRCLCTVKANDWRKVLSPGRPEEATASCRMISKVKEKLKWLSPDEKEIFLSCEDPVIRWPCCEGGFIVLRGIISEFWNASGGKTHSRPFGQ